mmetsp:Transcript_66044/g.193664  ORF Transcript_66044/g.193664 Transcript_66044/m.193664 type:complete len:203 (+) Transcript_66044:610-1218(+)
MQAVVRGGLEDLEQQQGPGPQRLGDEEGLLPDRRRALGAAPDALEHAGRRGEGPDVRRLAQVGLPRLLDARRAQPRHVFLVQVVHRGVVGTQVRLGMPVARVRLHDVHLDVGGDDLRADAALHPVHGQAQRLSLRGGRPHLLGAVNVQGQVPGVACRSRLHIPRGGARVLDGRRCPGHASAPSALLRRWRGAPEVPRGTRHS